MKIVLYDFILYDLILKSYYIHIKTFILNSYYMICLLANRVIIAYACRHIRRTDPRVSTVCHPTLSLSLLFPPRPSLQAGTYLRPIRPALPLVPLVPPAPTRHGGGGGGVGGTEAWVSAPVSLSLHLPPSPPQTPPPSLSLSLARSLPPSLPPSLSLSLSMSF